MPNSVGRSETEFQTPHDADPEGTASSHVFAWLRMGFRVVATIGLVQSFLGLALIAANPWVGYIDDVFLIVVFGGSSVYLFHRQPQFAAIFALISSAYAESVISHQNWVVFPASFMAGSVIWLLLLQHPVALAQRFHKAVMAAVLMASLAGLAFALAGDGGPFHPFQDSLAVLYYSILIAGAATLTQRCLAAGLLKSPRTIVFALSLAPVSLTILSRFLLGAERLPPHLAIPLNCTLAIAPIGTLLFEFAQRRQDQRTSQRT